jgi:predicted DNA-binding ribbon-helix-helix protein
MKSAVVKRSIIIHGHKTSLSVEDPFWAALKEIAAERRTTLSGLVSIIDHERGDVGNLSSALRLFVLADVREAAASAARPRSDSSPP